MRNTMTKLVTPTRFRQLLDCYGTSPSAWPEDERKAALTLLKTSSELQTMCDQAQSLDRLLAQHQAQDSSAQDAKAVQSLEQRIMHELPEQDGIQNQAIAVSVHRPHRSRIWIGSLAASLFIASLSFGVIHQLFGPGHSTATSIVQPQIPDQQNNLAGNDFDKWAWEDITGESLTTEIDNGPATMLALVDMELPAE